MNKEKERLARIRASNLKWKHANNDKTRETNRIWRKNNPDKKIENNRRYREKHHEETLAYRRKYRMANPAKIYAHTKARYYLKLKDATCFFCGAAKNLVRHHSDYNKALDVVILCTRCHSKLHQLIKELEAKKDFFLQYGTALTKEQQDIEWQKKQTWSIEAAKKRLFEKYRTAIKAAREKKEG